MYKKFERGRNWLDSTIPDWKNKVSKIDIDTNCPLTQLGLWDKLMEIMGESWLKKHGFFPENQLQRHILNQHWKGVLNAPENK